MTTTTDQETEIMAKTEAPGFVIQKRTADQKPGKYDAEIQALIDADADLTDEEIAEGVFNSIVIQVPLRQTRTRTNEDGEEEEVEIDSVAKYKRYFQDSAKKADRTAREVSQTESEEDNTVRIEFRLTEQVKRPRKPKDDDPLAGEGA